MQRKTGMIAICALLATTGAVSAQNMAPLTVVDQGSFAVGGAVKVEAGTFDPRKPLDPAGQSYHGDHASVVYQVPQGARPLPIVMLHGAGQSARSWQTTPDGREGFQTLFLRRRYATYLIDQPRRGQAGRSMAETAIKPQGDEQLWFNQFRVGLWPTYFDGVQFDHSGETLNQFFRAMTPNTGPFDMGLVAGGTSALFDRIGPAILFTHSQGGGPGWLTAIRNPKVRAVVAFEPGSSFVFPEGEMPAPIPSAFDTVKGEAVSPASFAALTKIPILILYGDNIPDQPVDLPAQDSWRARVAMARAWRDTVNRHGGDVTLIELPKIGIRGNTHFLFSDLNNGRIADLVAQFLSDKRLDR